jgi:hypothetical protein
MNEKMNDKLACDTLEMVDKMIEELNKKGTVTASELESLKKAYELRMDLQSCYGEGGMSETGMSYGRYTMHGTYDSGPMYGARGRSPVTGRYISRDGMMHDDHMMGYNDRMSGHSIKDRMVARLEAMYDEAKSEHERDEIRNEIRRIETER